MRLPARARVAELISEGRVWGVWTGAVAFYLAVNVVDLLSPKERSAVPTGTLLLLTSLLATLDFGESWWERGIVGMGFVLFALPLWTWTQGIFWGEEVVRMVGVAVLSALMGGALSTRLPETPWWMVAVPFLILAPSSPWNALRAVEEEERFVLYFFLTSLTLFVVEWRPFTGKDAHGARQK